MYKVIIVEDEKRIREGLKILVDWESLGFKISRECDNGADALRELIGNQYQLLISDIRLPGKGGLDMLREARAQGVTCMAVIISGYADFEYAKAAIDCGVKKYLLKPVNEQEFAETLRAIKTEMDGGVEDEQAVQAGLEAAVIKYIETNYAQNVTIKKMSEDMGYNPCYIGRAFMQKTGVSMKDYLYMVRIRKASKLLIVGRLKIQDVAYEVGFTDLNKFYQEFKRLNGATPKEFLSSLRKQN